MMNMKKIVVWCVGNPLMRDDGVGPALFSELASEPMEHLEPVDCETTPENWIARLRQSPPEVLLIADAADMGLPGGTIRKMSLDDTGNISFSSHGIPLSLILEPFRKEIEIAVIAVQPLERGFGEELSPAAAEAVRRLSQILRSGRFEELECYQEKRSPR
jgi:hydrogenase 3 maturation protease